jgi:heme exporter protein A
MISGLAVQGLSVARGDRVLFEGLDFEVRAGEAVVLTGANGAGKTSLLRAVAGLLRPAAGAVRFESANGALDADEARRGALHFVGHQDGLKAARTARQELAFQARWTGASESQLHHAVEILGLTPLLDLEVRVLSAGQRRKLALARLIAGPRSLWLLDEPMAPLDAVRRKIFGELMEAHIEDGGLILAAVHDPLPLPTRAVEVAA